MSDFVLVRYALYADGELVDTNDPEVKADANDKPILIKLGEGKAFPKEAEEALKNQDVAEIELPPEKSPYGPYDRSLIKAYSTRSLTRILGRRPKVGETIMIGNSYGRVIHVDRQSTLVDFNHPLAGKKIKYVLKVVKRIEDDKELIRRLLYQLCDDIKPEEVTFEEGEELTVVLPKGRIRCPGVENKAIAVLKERNKLRDMIRKKPLKAERLEEK